MKNVLKFAKHDQMLGLALLHTTIILHAVLPNNTNDMLTTTIILQSFTFIS